MSGRRDLQQVWHSPHAFGPAFDELSVVLVFTSREGSARVRGKGMMGSRALRVCMWNYNLP